MPVGMGSHGGLKQESDMKEPPSLIHSHSRDRKGQDMGGCVRTLGQRLWQLALDDGGGYGEKRPHL